MSKNLYRFQKYVDLERWVSYWHQIDEILRLKPKNVLEIGVGNQIVSDCLKRQNLLVKTLDIDKGLSPDVIANVIKMPLADNSFDLILCAEVLEHLPFEEFEQCLKELKRVTKKYVVLSLPHFGPPLKLAFKIPFLKQIKLAQKIAYHPEHKSNSPHYWEIGKKGYSAAKIKKIIKKYFKIKKEFIPFETQYHHFCILEK
jgi:predicted SAM-dependent methyltransferase